MTPKRIHHGIFFVLLAVTAATGTPLRRIHENQMPSSNHIDFDKSQCTPRSHNVDPSTTPETKAPDLFRVQLTLTTTPTESPTPTTKLSTLMIQFNRTWSPIGVDRFYQLVLDHYFDCAGFFRVVPGTIISTPPVTNKQNVPVRLTTRRTICSHCNYPPFFCDSLLMAFRNRFHYTIWHRVGTGTRYEMGYLRAG